MNPEDKEALSAWIDGESEALEERRLLRDHEARELAQTVARWQVIGEVIRNTPNSSLEPKRRRAQFGSIQQALVQIQTQSPAAENSQVGRAHAHGRQFRWYAVAASLTLVMAIGALMPQDMPSSPIASQSNDQVSAEIAARQPIFVSAGDVSSEDLDELSLNPELRALDEASRAQLRAYLQQHDQLSQLATQQRLVSYPRTASKDQ